MDSFHPSSSASAAERLNAFRQPTTDASTKRGPDRRKNELLMGVVVMVVGVLVITFVLFRPSKNQVVIGKQAQPVVSTDDTPMQLLADEALISLSVQLGHFPPQLEVGDSVRIAITPGIDGATETQVLAEDAVVADISSVSDNQSDSVITVRAPQSVLARVASSGPIHVAKINGGGK